MMTFTRSLAKNLMDRGIRVNGVAPGPVYTESLMASLSADEISFEDFVREWSPMGRAAQPHEIAPCYLFLADEDASGTMTGQVLHPNCGMVLNA
jgi:NAD(P)-dependent dehydrogenase (short-subunit alcohol dehydrogenase family)